MMHIVKACITFDTHLMIIVNQSTHLPILRREFRNVNRLERDRKTPADLMFFCLMVTAHGGAFGCFVAKNMHKRN